MRRRRANDFHSFYWEKIDGAVNDLLAADPTCAMAYWAKAVASIDNALGSLPGARLGHGVALRGSVNADQYEYDAGTARIDADYTGGEVALVY